jgi:hypothetical protein
MDERRQTQHGTTQHLSGGRFSRLDWPTPEQLREARRARGLFLRELVVAGTRRIAQALKPNRQPVTAK